MMMMIQGESGLVWKNPRKPVTRFTSGFVTSFPGKAIIEYPEKSVARFLKKPATRFLGKEKSVARFLKNPVTRFPRKNVVKPPGELAPKFPGRAVIKYPEKSVARLQRQARVKIQAQVCKTDMRRYCEKTSIIFPFLVEEQNCNSEPKKIYEWEMKTHSKKHHYTEDCKKQNNEIYAQYVKKTLKPT